MNNCPRCIADGLVCMVYTWGRCCHWCERRQFADCPHNVRANFLQYCRTNRDEIIASSQNTFSKPISSLILKHLSGFPFGRDKFTLDELMPSVKDTFKHLKRCYFNRIRAQYKDKINAMTDIIVLVSLSYEFTTLGYAPAVIRYVQTRIDELVPSGANATPQTITFVHFLSTF